MIPTERVQLIKDNFIEFSFESIDGEEITPDFEVFQGLSSAEQYYLASIYNWDDGTTVLDWIIDSPKCDRGTAIMIFWMAEPDYYFDFTLETIDDWAKDVWLLLQKIISKMRNEAFTTSNFGFSPAENGYQTNWDSANGIWELPDALVKGTTGPQPIELE